MSARHGAALAPSQTAHYWYEPSAMIGPDARDSAGDALATAPLHRMRTVSAAESGPLDARRDNALRPSDALRAPEARPAATGAVWAILRPSGAFSAASAACYALTTPTYRQVHDRIRRERGPASARACHWCGRRASQWACLCEPADTVTGSNADGRAVTYSPDPADYVPACAACHRGYDAERTETRRATAALALTPLPKRSPARRRRTPDPIPTAEPLFDLAPDGEMIR